MGRGVYVPHGAELVAYQGLGEEDQDYDGYEILVDYVQDRLLALWPSVEASHRWIEHEGRVVAENYHGKFGVSSYGSVFAIWFVADDDPLSKHWAKQIGPKFHAVFDQLRPLGTFSNGETVYERIVK